MPSADSILAVDPGLNNPAAAIFRGGQLIAASRVKPYASWSKLDIGERCRLVGRRIHDWACEHGIDEQSMITAYRAEQNGHVDDARALRQAEGVVRLVAEWPQVYTTARSKGDPNDLPPLAGVVMCLAGRLDIEVRVYKPAQWIGQVKKIETGDPLDSPRGRLIWRHLSAGERERVVLSHDAIDAVGLGLKDLDRLRLRVYPGAS